MGITKDFKMCGHPELTNMVPPTKTVGSCPVHNYVCPTCGFGVGTSPPCSCFIMLKESFWDRLERWGFGTHIHEVVLFLKSFGESK